MRCFAGLILLFSSSLSAQVDQISLSNSTVAQVLLGNYQAADYAASQVIDDPHQIACEVDRLVSADSLRLLIEVLSAFETRHTWSDTLSQLRGIGATRRWAWSRFRSISRQNENRLLVSYLNFDVINNTCGPLNQTRNVLAVLPGRDPSQAEPVLLMAHMDSRCEGRCDTACLAPGADDNGSGTALVLELARVLSTYTFDHSLIFLLTTGEEQGLLGATAFAQYCEDQGIALKGLLNNDIVGGVICGETASPPGCSPAGSIDSLRVRLYTNPLSDRNPHQGYARALKLLYQEKLGPNLAVPMEMEIVNQEDRSGRGGDHIPFRARGVRNVRFTSAHEHGNGNPLGTPNYRDHQHTGQDVIGVDTDNDAQIDSFFVDFNYLRRNAVINGSSAAYLALGPEVPSFEIRDEASGLRVVVTDFAGASSFRLGVKGFNGTEYDSLYPFSDSSLVVPGLEAGQSYFIGLAGLDQRGVMSPFTQDERRLASVSTPTAPTDPLALGINCSQLELPAWRVQAALRGLHFVGPTPNPGRGPVNFRLWTDDAERQGEALELVIWRPTGKVIYRRALRLSTWGEEFSYSAPSGNGLLLVGLRRGSEWLTIRKLLLH